MYVSVCVFWMRDNKIFGRKIIKMQLEKKKKGSGRIMAQITLHLKTVFALK